MDFIRGFKRLIIKRLFWRDSQLNIARSLACLDALV